MSDLHNLPGDVWELQGGVLFLAALSSGHAIFRRWSGQLEQSGIARSSLRTLGYPRRQHLFAQVKGVNIWKIAVGLTVRNDLHKLFECLAVVLNMLNDQCHWVGRNPELIHFFSSPFFFPLPFSAQPVAMGQPLDPLRGLSAHLNEVIWSGRCVLLPDNDPSMGTWCHYLRHYLVFSEFLFWLGALGALGGSGFSGARWERRLQWHQLPIEIHDCETSALGTWTGKEEGEADRHSRRGAF